MIFNEHIVDGFLKEVGIFSELFCKSLVMGWLGSKNRSQFHFSDDLKHVQSSQLVACFILFQHVPIIQ